MTALIRAHETGRVLWERCRALITGRVLGDMWGAVVASVIIALPLSGIGLLLGASTLHPTPRPMSLPKNILALMQKRAEAIAAYNKEAAPLKAKLDKLNLEIAGLEPQKKKIAELEAKIIEAAEAKADDIFADAASHTHAGQVLKQTSGQAVQVAGAVEGDKKATKAAEEKAIFSLESVSDASKWKSLAEQCVKIETSLNKAVIKAELPKCGEFFIQHGLSLVTTTNITLKDAA